MPFDPEAVRAFELARWQQAASAYEASFATATQQFIDPLLDAVDIAPGTRLLDIACGPGLVTARATHARCIVTWPGLLARHARHRQEAQPGDQL